MRNLFLVPCLVATFGVATLAQDPAAAVLEEPAAAAEKAVPDGGEADKDDAPAAEEPQAPAAETESPVAEPESSETPADPAPVADEADEPEAEEEAPDEEPEAVPAAPAKSDWAGLLQRAPKFLALTHHAAVHLPIALWLFGAFFVVVGAVVPSWRTQVPLACLIGGALTSVAAVASGWWYADFEYGEPWAWGDGFGDWSEHLVKHRWLGFALAVASIGLSVLALVSRARESRRLGVVWRLGLILLALAVSWEGHIGGELIHGEGFLEEAFQEWVSPESAEE